MDKGIGRVMPILMFGIRGEKVRVHDVR